MRVSLRWAEEVLGAKITAQPEEISARLVNLGFQTAALERYAGCSGVVAAKVLEISKHPNADRLRIAKVTDGKDTLDVVCGAPNIEVGQTVPWARAGALLADGTRIQETAIRGVKSPGMICSAKELGLGENHAGIWPLSERVPLGASLQDLAELEDVVFDFEVTPNRPDCLSVTGLAREMALGLDLRVATPPLSHFSAPASLPFYPVEIAGGCGCPRYIARKIDNVAVGPSSPKVQARLIRAGIRPVNNVVDVTNYLLIQAGQPLHAFDADKLAGGKIVVRRARAGEKILALDGKTYALDPGVLVIADAEKPVAIAGVMGGEETAVTAATRNVLLESAMFEPGLVRSASRKLGLASESSYRFERGVSVWSSSAGSALAQDMMERDCGGRASAFSDTIADPALKNPPACTLRLARIERLTGEKVPAAEAADALRKLEIPIVSSDEEKLIVRSADWRLDLNLEIDFIEELARVRGYGRVASAGTRIEIDASLRPSPRALRSRLGGLLQAMGFYEAYHYGLVSEPAIRGLVPAELWIEIANPLSQDQRCLRPALAAEMLNSLSQNVSYQKKDVRLFEIGKVFLNAGGVYREAWRVAGAALGRAEPPTWQAARPAAVDLYWIRGAVETLLGRCGLNPQDWSLERAGKTPQPDLPFPDTGVLFHPLGAFDLVVAGRKAGVLGSVHPRLCKSLNLPESFLFELDADALAKGRQTVRYRRISFQPSIERDCSLWVQEGVAWGDLWREILACDRELLKECALFDVYREPARPGRKSFSFTLTFQHAERTLQDEEANAARDRIVARLEKFGAELRRK